MNAIIPSQQDIVMTEAIVRASETRSAAYRSQVLRNGRFGAAAFVGAVGIAWAAIQWGNSRTIDPTVLAEALKTLPPLKVETVKVDPNSTVKLAAGGEVRI